MGGAPANGPPAVNPRPKCYRSVVVVLTLASDFMQAPHAPIHLTPAQVIEICERIIKDYPHARHLEHLFQRHDFIGSYLVKDIPDFAGTKPVSGEWLLDSSSCALAHNSCTCQLTPKADAVKEFLRALGGVLLDATDIGLNNARLSALKKVGGYALKGLAVATSPLDFTLAAVIKHGGSGCEAPQP